MNILVLGGGFVGTVTAVVFAEHGHQVGLIERDPQKRRALQHGRPGFEEPGLAAALERQLDRGTLTVPDTLDAAPSPDVAFVCVGTPPAANGAADLRHAIAASQEVARHMTTGVIAIKSTVPPGTTKRVITPAVHAVNPTLSVASVPEFLAEGDALAGARNPERVVIGSEDDTTSRALTHVHGALETRIIHTDPTTSEAIKYASNVMLAARVGVVNELANVFDSLGVAVDDVMDVIGMDPRIGPLFLQAGLGFGGSCFGKDVSALCAVARHSGTPMRIMEQVLAANDDQPLRAVHLLEEELGPLQDKKIALLGLSFKPGTSDIRESRAVILHEALRARGAHVVAHDPVASDAFCAQVPEAVTMPDAGDALSGADACVLATAWPEYHKLPWKDLTSTMNRPIVIDGWRHLDPNRLGDDVHYRAIGQGRSPRTTTTSGTSPPTRATRPAAEVPS